MKFETKYNLRDEVWFMFDDRLRCEKISEISVKATISRIMEVYTFSSANRKTAYKSQDELYLTKEELLKSL